MSEHGGGAPGAAAAAAVHPCLCCVFVILLPGVPGWANKTGFADELKRIIVVSDRRTHARTDYLNLYIRRVSARDDRTQSAHASFFFSSLQTHPPKNLKI